jgi:2-polyprenyl-6-methoxyphenol hydroxylase-like FAD-dependent oxidoreductase
MKVLRRLGLERRLLDVGIQPDAFVSRASDTGATLHELSLDAASEARFGGPYINIHRGDLHGVLETALAPGTIAFDHSLTGLERRGNALELAFADGARHQADMHHLQGAREPVRLGAPALHRARRPPRDLPDRAAERRHDARLHEVVGP